MSPIQTDQHPPARKKSVNMRRAQRYLARARALMRLDDAQPPSDDLDVRAMRSARSLRVMMYSSLATAYAERALIEQDEAARKRQANRKSHTTDAKRAQNAG